MRIPEAMQPLLRVWSNRNYACFMGGMTPNLITLWMQRMGTLWLAWELTHSNAWVGAIVAADYAPMMVLAPFVGAFVDKSNPVTVQKATQAATLVLSGLLAVLTFTGLMTIWLLLALSLVIGCLHPFNAISRHAIVPNTVPRAQIATALATDSALYNAARFVGPALAGIVMSYASAGWTFAANSFGCACYLIGIFAMRLDLSRHEAHGRGGMLGDILEGLNYVRGHAGIGPLFLLMAIGAVWIRPLQDLLPGFSAQVFQAGPSGLGWLTAAMGVGATISAALVAVHARLSGLTLAILLGFLANLAATLGFSATSSLSFAMLMGAIWGGTLTLMSTGTQALVQSSVDNALRARVMSLYTMIYRGAPFLGALIIGIAADWIGLQLAFVLAVLLCILPWLSAIRRLATMTYALEGESNDFDQRLRAWTMAWAGLQYERLMDLKSRAGPAATYVTGLPDRMLTATRETIAALRDGNMQVRLRELGARVAESGREGLSRVRDPGFMARLHDRLGRRR